MGAYITDREYEALMRHMGTIAKRTGQMDPSTRIRVYNATRMTTLTLQKAQRRAKRLAAKA